MATTETRPVAGPASAPLSELDGNIIDPKELNDLAAFAGRGGLGLGVARIDCVAEAPGQLMFLTHDELVILRDMGPVLVAACEGVVGWVKREDVDVRHLTPAGAELGSGAESGFGGLVDGTRSSSAQGPTSSPSPMRESLVKGGVGEGMPRTVIVAPSPSPPLVPAVIESPASPTHTRGAITEAETDARALAAGTAEEDIAHMRISNQSDLDSPIPTPGSTSARGSFAAQQQQQPQMTEGEADVRDARHRVRPSLDSIESDTSSALGGIGGLLLGDEGRRGSEDGDDTSTGIGKDTSALSPVTSPLSPTYAASINSAQSGQTGSSQSWDIYETYARDSMYVKRASVSQSRAVDAEPAPMPDWRKALAPADTTRRQEINPDRYDVKSYASIISDGSFDDEGRAFEAARKALERVGQTRQWAREDLDESRLDEDDEREEKQAEGMVETPVGEVLEYDTAPPPRPPRRRPIRVDSKASSDATDEPETAVNPITPRPPPRMDEVDSSAAQALSNALHQRLVDDDVSATPRTPARADTVPDEPTRSGGLRLANPDTDDASSAFDSFPPSSTPSAPGSSTDHDTSTPVSSKLLTPSHPTDIHFSAGGLSSPLAPSPTMSREPSTQGSHDSPYGAPMLGSPVPLNAPKSARLASPLLPSVPGMGERRPSDSRSPVIARSPIATGSAMTPPMQPWSPATPGSPHSIAATRQAVELGRKTPPASAGARKVTLVGHTDAELSAATGPVPITFVVDDPAAPARAPLGAGVNGLGLGLPSHAPVSGRSSPLGMSGDRRPSSPAVNGSPVPPLFIEDTERALKHSPSPYPAMRSATNPLPPAESHVHLHLSSHSHSHSQAPNQTRGPKPGFFPRPRSRSFSAAVNKALGKKSAPALTIDTAAAKSGQRADPALPVPVVPRMPASAVESTPKRPFFARQSSLPQPTAPLVNEPEAIDTPPLSPAISINPDLIRTGTTPSPTSIVERPPAAHESSASLLAPSSARSGTFGFRRPSKGSKTSLGPGSGPSTPRQLPSPVSHKDFATGTVKADGLDFEMVQPKRPLAAASGSAGTPSPPLGKGSLASSALYKSASSLDTLSVGHGMGSPSEEMELDLSRKGTIHSAVSASSAKSTRTLPETDEWGFVKERMTTPEIFLGRAAAAGQRAAEQKWLAIINAPLTGAPAKKVRKLAVENGVPASLRGRVWAWFMAGHMSARRPGLYQELLAHWKGNEALEIKIDGDVERAYPDHSIYSEGSTGQADLRSILRAYSNFATGGYRSEMALVAGMLLIHCVAEDAFWLFAGFVNGVLREYYAAPGTAPAPPAAAGAGGIGGGAVAASPTKSPNSKGPGKATGLKVDAGVFVGVLWGSEPKLGKLFKDLGIHPVVFLKRWWKQLFIRCLPWPTALRVIDAVVAEGPRFLIIAALAVLTVSKDRVLAMRHSRDVLAYLRDLPHDALLLPESFMRACEAVKFREDDYRKLKASVERELGV